jgi:hypothetical protein
MNFQTLKDILWQKFKFPAISITESLILFSKTYKQSGLFIQNSAMSFPEDKRTH